MSTPWASFCVALTAPILLAACSTEPTASTTSLHELEVARSVTAAPRPLISTRIEIPWLPRTVQRWDNQLIQVGEKHRVEPELLAIITLVESGGYSRAKSRSGAIGLMQLMPPTAKEVASLQGVRDHKVKRLNNPEYNLALGSWYLARQLETFRADDFADSVERAAAAYNGGPNALQRHLDDAGTLSAQTIRYRYWVRNMWLERHRADSPTYQEWLAAGGERLIRLAEAEMSGRSK